MPMPEKLKVKKKIYQMLSGGRAYYMKAQNREEAFRVGIWHGYPMTTDIRKVKYPTAAEVLRAVV